ncbi:ribose 5-phosphate isomerase B [Curvivirga sp.]|uniref:ribose 5-phosphate isomerase B n=1 Tax=Curvivirga sp. TaxID=2856848 RepID=UPI003B5B101E
MSKKTIALASDHAGVDLKASLISKLEDWGYEALDLGPVTKDSVDYPDFADKLTSALNEDSIETGVLICGTGIGISIAANRHKHIRAALCQSVTEAKLTRLHNNANVLALGARIIGEEIAIDCLKTFLETEYEGGRHERRVAKMS